MKKSNKFFQILLSGVMLTAALTFTSNSVSGQDKPAGKPWPVPEKNAKMTSPVKSDASSIAAGKEVWNLNCKSCHGKAGLGDGTKAESLEISCGDFSSPEFQKQTDGELFYKTVEGRKPMPSFKAKLTENDCWSLVMYMRSLGKK